MLIDMMSYIHRWHFNTSNSFDLSGPAKALENRMLQRLQAGMLDPNSPLFSAASSAALGGGTAKAVPKGATKPKPKPKTARGKAKAKGKSKPKPKVKAKAKSGNKRLREDDEEAGQGDDDEATESENKRTRMPMTGRR